MSISGGLTNDTSNHRIEAGGVTSTGKHREFHAIDSRTEHRLPLADLNYG